MFRHTTGASAGKRARRAGGLTAGGLAAVGLAAGLVASNASALTYQTDVGVNFTFESSINITFSSADLIISNLAPSATADSNVIDVNVMTNNANGYTLNSSVGSDTIANNAGAIYNTRKLIHTTYTSTDNSAIAGDTGTKPVFSSIAYGSSLASLTDDNTWGYTYRDLESGGNNATWANYSGLPLYSDTTNIATLKVKTGPSAANGDDVEFKIAAKAGGSQPSGEYNNVVNFTVVGAPSPLTLSGSYAAAGKTKLNGYYKMQDMNSSICEAVDVEDDQLQVIDARDNKIYWIAKLKDGHCWMTQNLDLDLGVNTLTSGTPTLYHGDTDLGWGSDTATQSWTPANATLNVTYDSSMKGTFPSMGTATSDNYAPKSLDVGDWYYAGYDGSTLLPSTTVNYLTSNNRTTSGGVTTVNNGSGVDYYSTAPFTGTGTSNNGEHGHLGNYYNWSAAVASNDTSSYTSSTYGNIANSPQSSICPAGWRLPTITTASPTYDSAGSANEFARLVYLYNSNHYATASSAKLELSPLFFARGGYVFGSSLSNPDSSGYYWSSTVSSSSYTFGLNFFATSVNSASSGDRRVGFSIRCVAR